MRCQVSSARAEPRFSREAVNPNNDVVKLPNGTFSRRPGICQDGATVAHASRPALGAALRLQLAKHRAQEGAGGCADGYFAVTASITE